MAKYSVNVVEWQESQGIHVLQIHIALLLLTFNIKLHYITFSQQDAGGLLGILPAIFVSVLIGTQHDKQKLGDYLKKISTDRLLF